MASRAANRRERAAAQAPKAEAPEVVVELSPEQQELEAKRQAQNLVEAQRAAKDLKVVLAEICKHLGTRNRYADLKDELGIEIPAHAPWTVTGGRVYLQHETRLCFGLSSDATLTIDKARYGGLYAPYEATAHLSLSSNTGSPTEVMARLALHRDTAEKAAQAQMMLADWLGRRPSAEVEGAFAILAKEENDLGDKIRAARAAKE